MTREEKLEAAVKLLAETFESYANSWTEAKSWGGPTIPPHNPFSEHECRRLAVMLRETLVTDEPHKISLRPCPLCGGPVDFYENAIDFEQVWSITCTECNLTFDACEENQEDAAARWNNRK